MGKKKGTTNDKHTNANDIDKNKNLTNNDKSAALSQKKKYKTVSKSTHKTGQMRKLHVNTPKPRVLGPQTGILGRAKPRTTIPVGWRHRPAGAAPAKQSRAPGQQPQKKSIQIIDPITNKVIETVTANAPRIPRRVQRPMRRHPNKVPRVQKNTTDMCIADEKTKPWIKNFYGTLIQLAPGEKENKLFTNFLVKEKSPDFNDWWIPSDNYYSILCKANERFLPQQKGSLLTIKLLDGLQSDQELANVNNSVTLKVANIVDEPTLIEHPEGIRHRQNISPDNPQHAPFYGAGNDKWLLPETEKYLSARQNYLATKLSTEDSAIDDFLSMPFSKLWQNKSTNEAIKLKIFQYLGYFYPKISKQLCRDIWDVIFQDARHSQLSLDMVLTNLVNATLFLRNEFNAINQNFIVKLKHGIITPKQLTQMTKQDLLPELYYNPELDIQVKREKLLEKISTLITNTVKNLAINILLYKTIIDRSHFWTQHKNLQQDKTDKFPLSMELQPLGIEDVVPLQNLHITKSLQESEKQISPEDLEDLGGLIFYKDETGQLYCFTVANIKQLITKQITINPLSGKPFLPNFLNMIRKLNLTQISEQGYVSQPQEPGQNLPAEIDVFTEGDLVTQAEELDEQSTEDEFQPFIGATVVLKDLPNTRDGKNPLNGKTAKIIGYIPAKEDLEKGTRDPVAWEVEIEGKSVMVGDTRKIFTAKNFRVISQNLPAFIGANVVIKNLPNLKSGKNPLNGKTGKIIGFISDTRLDWVQDAADKWEVDIETDDGHIKKILKSKNFQVIPEKQKIDFITHQPIENLTTMSIKYGVGPDGYVMRDTSGDTSKDTSGVKASIKDLVDPDFINYIEQLVASTLEHIHQFNFEYAENEAKAAVKTQYCFSCSKRLVDNSNWATTINMKKKNGEFESNTYHIKCLYNAPFKI